MPPQRKSTSFTTRPAYSSILTWLLYCIYVVSIGRHKDHTGKEDLQYKKKEPTNALGCIYVTVLHNYR